jgi:diguanylate cyclase (GGDEF)-like protein
MGNNLKQSILLVDADSANQASVKAALKNLDLEVIIAESTEEVSGLVLLYDFALILFGVGPDNVAPFETAVVLNGNEKTWYVPIMFQAKTEQIPELLEQGYAAGGVDFLQKPIRPKVLRAKVKVFLELDARQQQLAFATATIQKQNLKLEERAIRDSLTGLYNHKYLQERLAREISLARRYDAAISVFLLDLDFFKDVNDSCGHPFGDFVLKSFSERVQQDLRESDVFGRYGGEEFLIILPNTDSDKASVVAEKIRKTVAATVFSNSRYSRYVTVSIGVYSGFAKKIDSSGVVIDYVDNALYQAKAEGRNRVCYHKQPRGSQNGVVDHISDMIGTTQQSQLSVTIEKSRAMTLASFEAMIHAQTREYDMLADRNLLFTKVLDHLAKQLNLPDQLIHSFRRAIKLHDLFRCYIHDSSLETDGPLNKEQEDMLFDQPLMLRELTTMFDFFSSERVILYGHHEHYDGTGYPEGLKGNEIPMASRIFALVDSFVAMVAPVSEKHRKSCDEVKKEIQKYSGQQFDPFLVDMLMKIIDKEEFFTDTGREHNAATE